MIHYEALEKLDALRGLEDVKKTTRDILAFIEVARKRKELGLKNERQSNHFVFTGKPGTGKTTVARVLGELLIEAKVLKAPAKRKDDDDDDDDRNGGIPFIEKGGADFADKFSGGAEKNVRKAFEEARGGVLFIDEAYGLQPPPYERSNGQADGALTTLVQYMENYRDQVIVILAGYPDKMNKLLDTNPGLRSRIAHTIHFPDYTVDELMGIAQIFLEEREYTMSYDFQKELQSLLVQESRHKDFSNGRTVRNILEKAMRNQAYRLLYVEQCLDSHDPDMFMRLVPDDLGAKRRPLTFI